MAGKSQMGWEYDNVDTIGSLQSEATKGDAMKGNEVFEGINIEMLADAVALRLGGTPGADRHELAARGARVAPPVPEHFGKVIHVDPKSRNRRVRFDEDELESALASKGLGFAARKVADGPVEVKLVMALLLGVGLSFEAFEGVGRQARCGFDNPLVEDMRVDAIASHFGVGRERLAAEIANAPAEMLAVLLTAVDLILQDPFPGDTGGDGADGPDLAA